MNDINMAIESQQQNPQLLENVDEDNLDSKNVEENNSVGNLVTVLRTAVARLDSKGIDEDDSLGNVLKTLRTVLASPGFKDVEGDNLESSLVKALRMYKENRKQTSLSPEHSPLPKSPQL